ncbi:MAG TPA: hypothetical protein VJL31_10355 [Gemmatimonadales bacterium]|nr:hypothetical protein [Gemmatimonadales bacterium]
MAHRIRQRLQRGGRQQGDPGELFLRERRGFDGPPPALGAAELRTDGRKRGHAGEPHDRERHHRLQQCHATFIAPRHAPLPSSDRA